MTSHYLSLYYGSLKKKHAYLLMRAWFQSLFKSSDKDRLDLHEEVKNQLRKRIAVFSYTSARGALAACLQSAGIGSGDKVLISSFTCLAVPTAILAAGALPVYLDIDPITLNVPVNSILNQLTCNVKAVIIQHTLGSLSDCQSIIDCAKKNEILVIEDCALSIGSKRNNKLIGMQCDASIYSMELSKTISTGWGGILAVSNSRLAKQVQKQYQKTPALSFYENSRRAWQIILITLLYQPKFFNVGRYIVALAFKLKIFKGSTPVNEILGEVDKHFIAKLSGAQAVLGKFQWSQITSISKACFRHALILRRAILQSGLLPLGISQKNDYSVSPRVPFIVLNRPKAIQWFAKKNVELGTWFDGPLSPLPESTRFNYDINHFISAKKIANHIVNLPCHSGLSLKDIKHIKKILGQYVEAFPEEKIFAKSFISTNCLKQTINAELI